MGAWAKGQGPPSAPAEIKSYFIVFAKMCWKWSRKLFSFLITLFRFRLIWYLGSAALQYFCQYYWYNIQHMAHLSTRSSNQNVEVKIKAVKITQKNCKVLWPGVRMSLQFRDKKQKFENLFFIYFVISLGSFEYWKVIFRIFLQNNKPFPVFQKYGSVSPRNRIINWEHLTYFCYAKMKMKIHFKESDFCVEILSQ
jgi:hypothetical protein